MTQYGHDVWQSEQGLTHRTVLDLAQSPDGYLWVATPEALNRFDGVRFTSFTRRGSPALLERASRHLLVDRRGRLWIATNGVSRFEPTRVVPVASPKALPGDTVTAILERADGTVVVTNDAGVFEVTEGRPVKALVTAAQLSVEGFRGLLEDGQGRLWFGTTLGLGVLDAAGSRLLTELDGHAVGNVFALEGDASGVHGVGTTNGLLVLRDGRFVRLDERDGLSSSFITVLKRDRHGTLWIGTQLGLNRLNGTEVSRFTGREGLSGNVVDALLEDREGSLWVGTEEGGLNRLRDTKFTVFGAREGLESEIIRCTFEDREGALWFGGYSHQLARLSGGRLTTFQLPGGTPDNRISSVVQAPDGVLWVATPTRLFTFQEGLFERQAGSPIPDGIVSLFFDSHGTLWVGTSHGLVRVEKGKATLLTAADGVPPEYVNAIHEDREGRLWIGANGGLCLRVGDRFQTFRPEGDGFYVWTIHEDQDGSLWLGTSMSGLVHFDGKGFRRLSIAEGLFDDSAYAVLEDDDGFLWMTSNNGIFKVSKKQAKEVLAGSRGSVDCVSYGLVDGLRNAECNGGTQEAGTRTRDGRLWFPTVGGLARIDPRNVLRNLLAPTVLLEEALVDGSPMTGGKVPPGSQRLELHYTATSLVAPAAVSFRYRLEGFDRDWVDARSRRTAYYTGLRPGRYRFHVTACNNDGVWSAGGAALDVLVQPRFTQTGWFVALLAALAALLAYGLYALRIRQLKSRFEAVLEERHRVARELHDTLVQGLTGAVVSIENARASAGTDPERTTAHLVRAREAATAGLEEARRSLWSLRSEAVLQGDLLEALSSFATERTAGTAIRTTAERLGEERRLELEVGSELLRIGQEAVTNAVRHAEPGNIAIRVRYEPSRVQLSIEDDGRGFDAATRPPRGRYGLIGLKERAERLGGEAAIHSAPGQGTRVEVALPVRGAPTPPTRNGGYPPLARLSR